MGQVVPFLIDAARQGTKKYVVDGKKFAPPPGCEHWHCLTIFSTLGHNNSACSSPHSRSQQLEAQGSGWFPTK